MTDETLKKAIDNLSAKKHVVSEDVIQAKRAQSEAPPLDKRSLKALALMEEFQKSIAILSGVFKVSRFDDIVFLLAHPVRLFTMQLLVGLLRGIGFALGFVFVVSIISQYYAESFFKLVASFF